jgi:hypothetical protein
MRLKPFTQSQALEFVKKVEFHPDEPEVVGGTYEIDVGYICSRGNGYKEILDILDDDAFIYKSEYNAVRNYLIKIKETQISEDKKVLDIF